MDLTIKFRDLVSLSSIKFDSEHLIDYARHYGYSSLHDRFKVTWLTVSVCSVFLITGFTIICYLVLFKHLCFQWLIQDWWAQNNTCIYFLVCEIQSCIPLLGAWSSWPDTLSLFSGDGLDAKLKFKSSYTLFHEKYIHLFWGLSFNPGGLGSHSCFFWQTLVVILLIL